MHESNDMINLKAPTPKSKKKHQKNDYYPQKFQKDLPLKVGLSI